jgi:alpha-ketoglutarate-dependent taurine dioxygenase
MDSIVSVIPLSKQILLDDGSPFPLALTPKSACLESLSDTVSFVETHREELLSRLLCSGAILFRGFPISDALAFDTFARTFNWAFLPYVGGAAPRRQVTSIVFTSNESPPSEPIPFHHEMAQVPTFPKHLMFFCEVPAQSGGETPIAYSPMVYNRIREALPDFLQKLEEKQVRYTRILPDGDDPQSPIGRGWQSTYQTQDRQHAEEVCREQGTGMYVFLNYEERTVVSFQTMNGSIAAV